MSLTVGELNAILSVDDQAMSPGLRRAEQALRHSGERMGDDAERAGRQAGEDLGEGIVRGADGRLRNARGRFVAAGRSAGEGVGEGLTEGGTDGADEAAQSIGDRLRDRMKLAAAGAGLAVGAVLMDSLMQAMEQGKITGRLAAQLGATPAEAQKYGHIAGRMYADAVTQDFQGAADAISATMRAGLLPTGATEAQIQSLSTKVSDLATTFDLDLGQTANAVGQAIKTGLAKDGTEALDVFTRGLQVMGPRADDLMDTFNEYSTIFRQVGIDATTATGLLAQGMKAGARDTDVVADAIKELVLITQGGGKKVDEAFHEIGLSGKQMQELFAKGGPSAERALDMLFDRLRAVKDPAKRSALALTLFGTKAEDTQKALFSLDPSKAAAALGQVGGKADEMGNRLRDNSGVRLEAFKRGMQQNLVDFLGGQVLPRMEGFFSFMGENKGLVLGLAAAVTALGVAFSVASIGVWAMNSAMLANPVFWIIAGIAAAVAGIVLLIVTYWDEIKGATESSWSWVVSKVQWAKDGILAAVAWLASLPDKVGAWWQGVKDRTVQIATAWVAWVAGLPGRVWSAISGLSGRLRTAATNAFAALQTAAAVKVSQFLGWVKGIPGRVTGAIGAVRNLLYSKGREIVTGLWNGVVGMSGWLRSKLIGWAKSAIPGPIAKALGIASPSKVTKAQGRWIARGLVDGLTGSTKQVKSAAYKLTDIVKDALTGKKERAALKRINKDANSLVFLANWDTKIAGQLKTAKKKLADLQKERDKLSADVRKGILDSANITRQETGGWPQTAETILAGLRQDTTAAQTFAKNLAALRKKGVRSDLVAQIAQAGVEGGASAAAALANANNSQIKQINSQQSALVKAAGQAGTTAGDAMYGAGIQAAQGLVRGLTSHQKYIEKTMLRIAKGMSKSIRAALGIKSPSRVMALVGRYTAQGLIRGMEGQRSAVNRSMASLVETPAAGSWDSASSRARAAASQRVVLELRSSGRAEDDYLMGRVRRGIRKVGGPDATFALTGRRDG
ncbi:phage tail tape measure protein [Streptomyces lincolnensis]|uniref:phage tail tape measure protein n=1 Tax=Streptomyces lincolnensis TaxID=1915 RepID=UPI001E6177FD|nr:phage tail tape measure protein [Streptomyces lincolnensis]MCD7440229.1 phage tail tape measure protein [Streptomyces lincolnensis]